MDTIAPSHYAHIVDDGKLIGIVDVSNILHARVEARKCSTGWNNDEATITVLPDSYHIVIAFNFAITNAYFDVSSAAAAEQIMKDIVATIAALEYQPGGSGSTAAMSHFYKMTNK